MNIYQKALELHLNFIKKRQSQLETEYGILNAQIKCADLVEKLRIEIVSTIKDSKELKYIEMTTNLLIEGKGLSVFDEYTEKKSVVWHVINPSNMDFYKEFEELLNG
jgi:hypothetical protein